MLNVKNRKSSQNATSSKTYVRNNSNSLTNTLEAVYITTILQQNSSHFHDFLSTWGFPKPQNWLYLEIYQLIPSNQKHFNIK